MLKRSLKRVIREYGPIIGPISLERAQTLLKMNQQSRMLCVVETGSNETLWGISGMHLVNVMDRYETEKPLPSDLLVFSISYGEGGLP